MSDAEMPAGLGPAEQSFWRSGLRPHVHGGWTNGATEPDEPPRPTVPAVDPARLPVYDWLYERAEEAASAGLPLEQALQAVRNGYSSIEFDRRYAAEEFAEETP